MSITRNADQVLDNVYDENGQVLRTYQVTDLDDDKNFIPAMVELEDGSDSEIEIEYLYYTGIRTGFING